MNDGTYVAYAKRNLSENTQLSNKIKKEAPMSKSQGVLPYANKVSQKKQNVNDTTKYSIQETQNNTQDNQGRELSIQQQEYFKDSKVRDGNGNLRVLYNGSGEHTIYNPAYMSDESKWGKGIYLTPYKEVAEQYGSDIKETYLNIKNPLISGKNITFEQYNNLYKEINDGEEAYREEYDMYDDDLDLYLTKKKINFNKTQPGTQHLVKS